MKPRFIAGGFSFVEAPRWHEGRLWAADLYTSRILAITAEGQIESAIEFPGVPTGLGWLPDGRLLVAIREHRLLRADPDGLIDVCDLDALGPAPLAELSVDPYGRVYLGVFGLASGAILRVDPDGSMRIVAEDLLLPNGQLITPDGRTLIIAESAGQRLTAFDINPDGMLSGRRTWANLGEPATATNLSEVLAQVALWPDGITLDAEGSMWVANPLGNEVLRIREGGEITDQISTHPSSCNACALGGPDGHTLFLCTAPPSQNEPQRRAHHQAALQSCRVTTPAAHRRTPHRGDPGGAGAASVARRSPNGHAAAAPHTNSRAPSFASSRARPGRIRASAGVLRLAGGSPRRAALAEVLVSRWIGLCRASARRCRPSGRVASTWAPSSLPGWTSCDSGPGGRVSKFPSAWRSDSAGHWVQRRGRREPCGRSDTRACSIPNDELTAALLLRQQRERIGWSGREC